MDGAVSVQLRLHRVQRLNAAVVLGSRRLLLLLHGLRVLSDGRVLDGHVVLELSDVLLAHVAHLLQLSQLSLQLRHAAAAETGTGAAQPAAACRPPLTPADAEH